jgi:hypothetical protein
VDVTRKTAIAALAAAGMGLAAACVRPGAAPATGAVAGGVTTSASSAARADSIVLERTRCYGFCPAYRLVLARTGEVRFRSIWPENTPPGAGTVSAGDFAALVEEAGRIGFWSLPDQIQGSALCPNAYTDAPGATVIISASGRTKSVTDYLGCREGAALDGLRAFEARIDSVAGSKRWIVTPATR